MTRSVRRRLIAAGLMTLALASTFLVASPAIAEEPAPPNAELPVVQGEGGTLPEPPGVSSPLQTAAASLSQIDSPAVLPPVTWPAHGNDPMLVHLTGAIFSEAANREVQVGWGEVRLKAKDEPHKVIDTTYGATFSFYNLRPGREYFLEIRYDGQKVYSGATPYRAEAELYAATTYEIPIVLLKPAKVSGRIAAFDRNFDGILYLSIEALRLNEATGQFEALYSTGEYDDAYEISGLYPGKYVFRGFDPLTDNRYSDEFYPGGDHLEDAVPVDVGAGEVLTNIDFVLPEAIWSIYRLSGASRYETSAEVSAATYAPGVQVLYVTSGSNWPDALSAGPAASKQGGALLLTDPVALPEATRAEIIRLAPERVVVVGGTGAVGQAVYRQIEVLVPAISRIAGADRYETSRNIVEDAFGAGPYETTFVATGSNFPDALSAGAVAGQLGQPVLLVNGVARSLDDPTRRLLSILEPDEVSIVGGPGAVSNGVEVSLSAEGLADSVRRVSGTDRYDTNSQLIAAYPPSPYVGYAFLANGTNFPDALAGAPAAAA